jgi:nicotinic acid phosphoribosyltransferase
MQEVYMSEKTYSILVMGTVERSVIVSGGSLAEAEANAYSEWARLTGGHVGTAECIEAHELEELDNGSNK